VNFRKQLSEKGLNLTEILYDYQIYSLRKRIFYKKSVALGIPVKISISLSLQLQLKRLLTFLGNVRAGVLQFSAIGFLFS